MQVSIFDEFGLKMPIYAPNGDLLRGILPPKWGAVALQAPTGTSLCINTRLSFTFDLKYFRFDSKRI